MAFRVLLQNFGLKAEMRTMNWAVRRGYGDNCQNENTTTTSKSSDVNVRNNGSSNSLYTGGTLHPDLQEALNRQLHTELTAAYSYMALEAYFLRRNVGLTGFALAQRHQVSEELTHARVLTQLLTMRDGMVRLSELHPPQPQEWSSPLDAVKAALHIETTTAKGLGTLESVAHAVGDRHVAHVIQTKLVDEQMESIHKLVQFVDTLESCSSPTCLLIIDRQLQQDYK